ncbi:MAG: RNA polymerase sigma factor [Gemmatimonadales bacterium]
MEDWFLPLQEGQPDVAWDRFLSRYRRLIFASIRHYTQDYDDGMEVFAHVCERLRADGMGRLRRRAEDPRPRAQFSTWLVTVVRHAAIDWFRHRDGRHRLSTLAQHLPPRQRRIFELVFLDRRSHIEAYELLRLQDAPEMSFREFLAELRATYRALSHGRRGRILRELGEVPELDTAGSEPQSPVETAERHERLQSALGSLPPEDRLAVELYVVQGLPAERVAAILGLANAKAVYNRVYRVLADLRGRLEQSGIRRGDL